MYPKNRLLLKLGSIPTIDIEPKDGGKDAFLTSGFFLFKLCLAKSPDSKALQKFQQQLLLPGGELGECGCDFDFCGCFIEKILQGDTHGIAEELQVTDGDISLTKFDPAQMGLGTPARSARTFWV